MRVQMLCFRVMLFLFLSLPLAALSLEEAVVDKAADIASPVGAPQTSKGGMYGRKSGSAEGSSPSDRPSAFTQMRSTECANCGKLARLRKRRRNTADLVFEYGANAVQFGLLDADESGHLEGAEMEACPPSADLNQDKRLDLGSMISTAPVLFRREAMFRPRFCPRNQGSLSSIWDSIAR
ncbi:unnamed protein product [Amoebophrya sp. A25]|nr:unnamed protein product [Amoebophrya sp. A25]|eukprot:GSA25T00011442001.1